MPVEYVESCDRMSEDEMTLFRVRVGWSRLRDGGAVQIASIRDTEVTGGDGFHVDLGRVEINDLIRLLRKARDQAFGRDE